MGDPTHVLAELLPALPAAPALLPGRPVLAFTALLPSCAVGGRVRGDAAGIAGDPFNGVEPLPDGDVTVSSPAALTAAPLPRGDFGATGRASDVSGFTAPHPVTLGTSCEVHSKSGTRELSNGLDGEARGFVWLDSTVEHNQRTSGMPS